jgi:hypothetical protein
MFTTFTYRATAEFILSREICVKMWQLDYCFGKPAVNIDHDTIGRVSPAVNAEHDSVRKEK